MGWLIASVALFVACLVTFYGSGLALRRDRLGAAGVLLAVGWAFLAMGWVFFVVALAS